MSLDGKILRRAKLRLDRERLEREELSSRRLEEVYRIDPRIREIDAELRSMVADAMGIALTRGENVVSAVEEISEDSLYLQKERAEALAAIGKPEDYTDDVPNCPRCRDTGYEGTHICRCLMDIYIDEQRLELSSMLNMGEACFDSFSLDYYDDTPDTADGISPRQNMETIYEYCVWYAKRFGKNSGNLFFYGPSGLGKTFLSACIAREVSESGHSVVYDTAQNVFSKFESEKFSRDIDDETRSDTHRYLTCDLLILDDLGTELSTSFVTSALYNLINTRLAAGKKTVISSNYSLDELAPRYSPQILSRLRGEYETFRFIGRDIRQIKKQQR